MGDSHDAALFSSVASEIVFLRANFFDNVSRRAFRFDASGPIELAPDDNPWELSVDLW